MRGKLLGWIALALATMVGEARAWEGNPVVGASVGAAIPTGDTRRSADIGASFGPYGGYRFSLFENSFAITVLGEPLYTLFPTAGCGKPNQRPCLNSDEEGVTGLFAMTFGPRLSLVDEHTEVYFTAKGGYYSAVSGSLDGDGGGFNLSAGVNYEFYRGMGLGIFARRDQADIDAATNSTSDVAFFVVGATFQYRFGVAGPVEEPPPPAPAAPPPAPVKQKIVLRGVNFDFNKADIRADARPILDEAIATLKQNPSITVAVDGYTDDIGTPAYNDKLSLRRAQAVERYLAAGGIAADRMQVFGFGESKPVASNETEDGRAQNRRVELRILTDQ